MRMSWRGPGFAVAVITLFVTTAGASTTPLTISQSTQPAVLAKTLNSRNATEAAAAAYWLGLKGPDAVPHIPRLVAMLGDSRPAQAAAYRNGVAPKQRTTPGEEAAGALARIGRPAVAPLIETLRTSSSSFARQNAAWALGQIDSIERRVSTMRPGDSKQNF